MIGTSQLWYDADYGLASVPVCRRVIIHTLGVYNEFVSTGIVPKLRRRYLSCWFCIRFGFEKSFIKSSDMLAENKGK
jgi:hypothetical protein